MWVDRFKKKKTEAKVDVFNSSAFEFAEEEKFEPKEAMTVAKYRLENGAKDFGYEKGQRVYNQHKVKIQNQWINPLQSINSGYGNAQTSFYNYQAVNYYECYMLSQDPLFTKIFNVLSRYPISNGGEVSAEFSEEQRKTLDRACIKYNVFGTIEQALRSNFVSGGCLVFMDFGQKDLSQPLSLKNIKAKDFKGFRLIEPINVTAVDVNSTEPAKADYMNPKSWYIVGMGVCHSSHFLKFEENVPPAIMKPLCMYFGMPLTLLIKQDVANSNLASQGLANLINRFRYLYLKTGEENFTGAGAVNFRNRLEVMSKVQDNFGIYPLKSSEDMLQLTTSLSDMDRDCEFFYQILASKTDITLSILLGKGAEGLSGTLEGERKNFYDRIRSIQASIKPNLLKMLGIVWGAVTDGKFFAFDDYVFNPLEVSDEKEKAENLRSYTEVAKGLIEIGCKPEDVMDWLRNIKDFHLENVDFDEDTVGLVDYEDEDGNKQEKEEVADSKKE